jgi:hypothetical protein
MEGKIWGILLSTLGIAGLIWALIYINGPQVSIHLPVLLGAGVCGALAFFMGVWLTDHKRSRQKGHKTELVQMADAKIQQS